LVTRAEQTAEILILEPALYVNALPGTTVEVDDKVTVNEVDDVNTQEDEEIPSNANTTEHPKDVPVKPVTLVGESKATNKAAPLLENFTELILGAGGDCVTDNISNATRLFAYWIVYSPADDPIMLTVRDLEPLVADTSEPMV